MSSKSWTRLRLGLSHLNEHRFNHNFENCVNPLCICSLEAETTSHFFLHCHYYHPIRLTLFNELCEIGIHLPNLSEEKFLNLILYESSLFLNSTIKYIIRFKLLQWVYFLKWWEISILYTYGICMHWDLC